jgi:hypothetical protein
MHTNDSNSRGIVKLHYCFTKTWITIETALLKLPALTSHPGADTTMTTKSPEQAWFVVTAVLCTTLPTLFLAMRVYTRLRIIKGLELVDCEYHQNHKACDCLQNLDCLFLAYVRSG